MPTACGPTGLSPGGAGSTPRNHPDSLRQRGRTQLVSRPAGDPSLQHLAKAVPAERRRGLASLLCPVACVGSELGLRKHLEPGRGGGRAATQGVSLPSPPSWPWGLRRRYLGRGGEEGPPRLSMSSVLSFVHGFVLGALPGGHCPSVCLRRPLLAASPLPRSPPGRISFVACFGLQVLGIISWTPFNSYEFSSACYSE